MWLRHVLVPSVTDSEEELKQLRELIAKLQAILDSRKLQMNVVKDEINAIKRKFKEERKSIIVSAQDEAEAPTTKEIKPVEHFNFIYTAAGRFKKVPRKNFFKIFCQ